MKYILLLLLLIASPAYADEWTGQDKAFHAAAGLVIGSGVDAAFHLTDSKASLGERVLVATGATAVLAAGKEMVDPVFSTKDFLVTTLFGVLGCGLTEGVNFLMSDKTTSVSWRF